VATSITNRIVCTVVPPGDTYRVAATITAATGIAKELFLFAYAGDVYQHVCTISDLSAYPAVRTEGYAFYRKLDVVLDFEVALLHRAEETADAIRERLQELATAYETAKADFLLDVTETYTG
jgi:hypothetical protein